MVIYLEDLQIPTTMYKRHMEFVLEMATSNIYTTEAFLRYDRYVTMLVQEGLASEPFSCSKSVFYKSVYL